MSKYSKSQKKRLGIGWRVILEQQKNNNSK